jgi:hypothetical protein
MYIPYQQAMRLARAAQPYDPCAPSRDGARKLHGAVAKELKKVLGLVEDRELRFYTAVRTPLDDLHQVDGWFEFEGWVITIDLTISDRKDQAKANVVVHAQEADDNFEFAAKDIADAFYWKRTLNARKDVYAPV